MNTLSYFMPVYEPSKLIKEALLPEKFIGYGQKDKSSGLNVKHTLISTPYDYLQSNEDLASYKLPSETQDRNQGKFIQAQEQKFIGRNAGWYQAPIQATYSGLAALHYTPVNKNKFQNPYETTMRAEEDITRLSIPLFY